MFRDLIAQLGEDRFEIPRTVLAENAVVSKLVEQHPSVPQKRFCVLKIHKFGVARRRRRIVFAKFWFTCSCSFASSPLSHVILRVYLSYSNLWIVKWDVAIANASASIDDLAVDVFSRALAIFHHAVDRAASCFFADFGGCTQCSLNEGV